jgi:hypothetical protein
VSKKTHKLTREQISVMVKMHQDGASVSQLGVDFDITPEGVRYWCKKFGEKCEGNRKLSKETAAVMVSKYIQGTPVKELMQEFGVGDCTIYYWLNKNGIKSNRNVCVPLSVEQQDEVVIRREKGSKINDIANDLNVNPNSVEWTLAKHGVVLDDKARLLNNNRKYPQNVGDSVEKMRLDGSARKDIANVLGISVWKVKSELKQRGIFLPTEIKARNSYQGILNKYPDFPNWIKERIDNETPEARRARGLGVKRAYENNPELKINSSRRMKKYWIDLTPEEKEEILVRRRGRESGQYKRMVRLSGAITIDDMLKQLADKHGGRVLDEYAGSKTHIRWECSNGHIWSAIPNAIQQGSWCPSCAVTRPSRPQVEICDYVRSLMPDETILISDRKAISPLELDIYVPSKRLGVEFDGLFWHSSWHPDTYDSRRHQKKALRCRDAEINLLVVFEDEWGAKKELLKSMIRWRLGKFCGTKLDARKLELRRLNSGFGSFFERNHLDGSAKASFAYGLYRGDDLMMCCSVRHNFARETEIARMATDYDYSVRGGAARLIKAIRQEIGQETLVSYSSNRVGSGRVYGALGFKLLSESRPSYWYTDGKSRIWRFRCKRNNDPLILAEFPTEQQQALNGVFSVGLFGDDRPLYKIHDYGHRKWAIGGA